MAGARPPHTSPRLRWGVKIAKKSLDLVLYRTKTSGLEFGKLFAFRLGEQPCLIIFGIRELKLRSKTS